MRPPEIKLVRVTTEPDHSQRGMKQRLNVILKNTGDTTAFLLIGYLDIAGSETIRDCNKEEMAFELSLSDWTYDVDLDSRTAQFVGRHSIEPNEVVNFDVLAGRAHGGFELSVYKCFLRLEFDEGDDLQAGPFFLKISGPTGLNGCATLQEPSPEQWGGSARLTTSGA